MLELCAGACKRLKKEFASADRLWASWGDYDRRQFECVCQSAGVAYPFGLTHLNVKTLFAVSMGLNHEVGLDGACERNQYADGRDASSWR